MNEPNSSLLNALHSIFSATHPKYISSICYAIQSHNPKYYSVLLKYCPEWNLEKEVDPTLYNQHPPVAQVQEDPWSYSWNQLQEVQAKGPAGFLESIQIVDLMRKNEVIPQRQQMLSQYIMSTLLPTISAYYLPQMNANQEFVITPVYIQNASSVLSVIQILQTIFPQESEYLLHLQSMTQQLLEAVKNANSDSAVYEALEKQAYQVQGICNHECFVSAQSHEVPSLMKSVQQYEEQVHTSKQHLQEYMDRIANPVLFKEDNKLKEKKLPVFPSLDSIAVSNTNEQLEEMGVIMLKRTGRCI